MHILIAGMIIIAAATIAHMVPEMVTSGICGLVICAAIYTIIGAIAARIPRAPTAYELWRYEMQAVERNEHRRFRHAPKVPTPLATGAAPILTIL